MSPRVPGELIEFLNEHERFYIAGHVEPDGDCIASSLALASYLRRVLGKTVSCHNVGPFNRREIAEYADEFSPRVEAEEIRAANSPAAVILDCTGPDRIGSLQADLEGLPTAVIDHHATSKPFGEARFVVTTSMATCHLVQLLMEELGGDITKDEAQLLAFGIVTDTGFFRHAEADAADLFAGMARLMEAGASPKTAHSWMFGGHSLDSRRLLATIMLRAEPIADGRGVVSWETSEDVKEYGKESRDSDTLYQLLFSIRGLRAAALVRQESDSTVSGSLRSIDTIDVSSIAARFGGGGHRRAAGFTVELGLDDAVAQVRDALESAIDSA
ncbi:MAG: DHH family phosphoesterase [Spirochaetota bacterium]